jgi:hypothetical protein
MYGLRHCSFLSAADCGLVVFHVVFGEALTMFRLVSEVKFQKSSFRSEVGQLLLFDLAP